MNAMELNKTKIKSYLKNLGFVDQNENVRIEQIHGGNINYIFRVDTPRGSYVLKQSLLESKFNTHFKMPADRTETEKNCMITLRERTRSRCIPKVYHYDKKTI